MTRTVFSVSGMHCSAAMMMFLLFGNTNTVEAGVLFTSRRMSSVEGFIVWPPVTIRSAPSERKRSAMPSPAHTATKPTSFSAGAISGSASASGWAGRQARRRSPCRREGVLVAHVLDLHGLERAVAQRFGQRAARRVRVDVDLDDVVVLHEHERVAETLEKAAQSTPDCAFSRATMNSVQ